MIDKEQNYYKRIKTSLIGRKITEVYYVELDYGTNSNYWEYTVAVHSIDLSIIFRLDNQQLIQIRWDNEFYSYGVGFEKMMELKNYEGVNIFNVTDNPNWKRIIGKAITKIVVYWDESYSQEGTFINSEFVPISDKKTIRLPQTWQIECEKEKFWIATLEINENEIYYWASHLTTIFTNEEQDKYKLTQKVNKQESIS